MKKQIKIRLDQLTIFIQQIFAYNGLAMEDAQVAARALVKANLRGVDSHGVVRLPMYCKRLRRGVCNARVVTSLLHQSPREFYSCALPVFFLMILSKFLCIL
jgi:LDH2 family malate/lactate/ureidoglycolate dehydrogenase